VNARPSILFCFGAWLRIRRMLCLKERIPCNEKLSVVLLSYRRPKNMRYIVDSLLACEFVREILLSNNNPEIRIEDFLCSNDLRLRIVNQPRRCFPTMRYDMARELRADTLWL
jgi:hypothetical protein